MTEEKAKSLIGRKVRGFKFEYGYAHEMDKHINEIGEIVDCFGNPTEFQVQFKDDYWYYPASLIEAHLVEENEPNPQSELMTKLESLQKQLDSVKEEISKLNK